MDINERIRMLREHLSLSQEEFGKQLGVSRSVIKNIDYKKTKPKELFVDLLCNVFHANREWLETGKGDMFTASSETIVDKLVKDYNLDDMDASIIRSYLSLTTSERCVVKKYITNIVNTMSSQPSRDDIIKSDIMATNKKLSDISMKKNSIE